MRRLPRVSRTATAYARLTLYGLDIRRSHRGFVAVDGVDLGAGLFEGPFRRRENWCMISKAQTCAVWVDDPWSFLKKTNVRGRRDMDGLSGLIGVVVGSVLSGFRDAWSDRKTRDRHARYLAIRVVCALDGYVEACTEVIADDGLCEGRGQMNKTASNRKCDFLPRQSSPRIWTGRASSLA